MKKRILKSAWKDAKATAGGIYRMNARNSIGYAFTVTKDRKSVNCGEFVYWREPISLDLFDGYIDFETGECRELQPEPINQ